jgi:hypothetical protein
MIVNYNCTVITIVNYDPNTFIVQATDVTRQHGFLPKDGVPIFTVVNYDRKMIVKLADSIPAPARALLWLPELSLSLLKLTPVSVTTLWCIDTVVSVVKNVITLLKESMQVEIL